MRGAPSCVRAGVGSVVLAGLAGRGARADLVEEAADAHGGEVRAGDGHARAGPLEHGVEAGALERAGAAGHAEHGGAAEPAEEEQVAGIDGHAEAHDLAAGALERGGDDVAPVDDGRRAEDEDGIEPGGAGAGERVGHGAGVVRHALSQASVAPQRSRRVRWAAAARSRTRSAVSAKRVERQRAAAAAPRPEPRRRRGRRRRRRRSRLAGTANGMIFTVATMSPRARGVYGATVATVIASSIALAAAIAAASSSTTPAGAACRFARPVCARSTVTPAPASAAARAAAAASSSSSPGSSRAPIDLADAGGGEGGGVGGGEHAAFLEHAVAGARGVREDRAEGLGDHDGPEPHGVAPRRAATISARIDTAISAGVRAPIRRPTGPRRRSSAAGATPRSPSRARRAACVFCEPRQPT